MNLHLSIADLSPAWIDYTSQQVSKIRFCIVSSQSSTSKQPLRVTHSLTVNEDLTWEVFVLGHKINAAKTCLRHIPSHLGINSLSQLLQLVEGSNVCPGNPDERFVELVSSKKGSKITSGDECTKAFIDDGYDVNFKGKVYTTTVRTTSCTILTPGAKCLSCNQYRPLLRSLHSRWSRKSKTPAKQGNNVFEGTGAQGESLHWGGEGEGLPFATSLCGGAERERCFSAGVSGAPPRTGRSVLMLLFASHPYWFCHFPLYTSLSFHFHFPLNVL